MESLYRTPFRVYLILALLSGVGIWSALGLPVSLFPNSTKPVVYVSMSTEMAAESFEKQYGSSLESQLKNLKAPGLEVEKTLARFSNSRASIEVHFKWGANPEDARKEVEREVVNLTSRLPEHLRRTVHVYIDNENSGFFAVNFYSQQRSLTEVYKILDPILGPQVAKVKDANGAGLWNPQQQQIQVELKPEAMAALQIFPEDVARGITQLMDSYGAGSMTMGTGNYAIEFPSHVNSFERLKQMSLTTRTGRVISLTDVAKIDMTIPIDSARVFKTSGAPSVMLYAAPKPGGNIKKMSEDLLKIVDENKSSWPADIEMRVLVDPSEFIRSAVNNVAHEVFLAAFLAVIILFVFVGNLKNVVTAAIEIPLSIVLAFIMMKISGMNLNMISLGGLALSAGMNVDASVVVMENIFRHFEKVKSELSFEEKLRVLVGAVNEVKFAVIASTIASLVVFIPLAFTSDLSNAILGDLAKAVVFSHGFSAIVALVLVPTIRLHLMAKSTLHETPSPVEKYLNFLETKYSEFLRGFLQSTRLKAGAYFGLAMTLALLIVFVVPRLPREILGKPDTDSLMIGMNVRGNTLIRQMEAQIEQLEQKLLEKYSEKVRYTFSQVNRPNGGWVMMRLNNKKDMEQMWKEMEELFPNTPFETYWIDAWNPGELPIPNPPDFMVSIKGRDVADMALIASDFSTELREKKIFDRINVEPYASIDEDVLVRPYVEQWPNLQKSGVRFTISDLADLIRTATTGKWVTSLSIDGQYHDIYLRYPPGHVSSIEDVASLPIGIGAKIVPIKALAQVKLEEVPPTIYNEDQRRVFLVSGRLDKGEEHRAEEETAKVLAVVESWKKKLAERSQERLKAGSSEISKIASTSSITVEDAKTELNTALRQLTIAISFSIALIFLTMVFQFGSLMNSLLVLVSVPLGLIGVVLSLWVFKSTLSLNSMLGVILLNGIAVANSIILVDFLQKAVRAGATPQKAAVEVARARLRPILMTSLTTALGMLPIALGLGEGGKILQPLGIAVAGGLGFSMITTLFIVPALQVSYLEWRARKGKLLHATVS